MSTLSTRGQALLGGSMPEYLIEHFTRSQDPWSRDNRDGYLGLCVAENALVWDLLAPQVRRAREVPASRFAYDNMCGSDPFRKTLAQFFGERLAGRAIDPANVVALAGAGAVLETLFYAIGDPGDGVLVPTPSYAGFWMDLEVRDDLRIVPVHGRSETGFRVGPADYQAALDAADRPVRALLLTNPDNPRGTMMPKEDVAAVLDWAESRGLHVIVDEIYAFSVFGERPFVSVLRMRERLGPKLHVVWAFSKDFAASGLRSGVLISENEELLAAVDALAYWSCVSGDTQHLLTTLLQDHEWLERYLTEMPKRLRGSYEAVAGGLDRLRIPYVPAEAAFFVLADFRRHLPPGDDGNRLWRRLVEEHQLNFTPGAACRIAEPGFMRICHAAVSPEAAADAMARLGRALGSA